MLLHLCSMSSDGMSVSYITTVDWLCRCIQQQHSAVLKKIEVSLIQTTGRVVSLWFPWPVGRITHPLCRQCERSGRTKAFSNNAVVKNRQNHSENPANHTAPSCLETSYYRSQGNCTDQYGYYWGKCKHVWQKSAKVYSLFISSTVNTSSLVEDPLMCSYKELYILSKSQ